MRNKIEIIIKKDLFARYIGIEKLFDMLTEIDGDSNDRKEQGSKKESAYIFTDDIPVNGQQREMGLW